MNKNLQTLFFYHEDTKHSQQKYARSVGYMDWATQPDPFRSYNGAKNIVLPLALENTTPPYHLLDSDLPCTPLVRESLSQLLQFSMGIAVWKVSGESSWALRCNASSGNLQPTEAYVILPPVLEEQNSKSTIFHYTPKNHGLDILAEFETSFWDELPDGSFLVGLSSISWREVWKYGERAFRYTNLDAGHAMQALTISAKMLGWKLTRLDNICDKDLNYLLGLKQENRFFESEIADMLLVVSTENVSSSLSIESLLENLPLRYDGIANKLSSKMQEWEIIPKVENATSVMQAPQKSVQQSKVLREPTMESKAVIINRRSVHVMEAETSLITKKQFHTILKSVYGSLDGKENSAHLVLFVHRVEEYKEGLYILVRNSADKEALKEHTYPSFKWQESELKNLFLLEERDLRASSKAVSCSQEIASDGAFSLGMLCSFSDQLQAHGTHRYKELHWECGAIGQQLYLEATSIGLKGTGIGCFLDDLVHNMLGLRDNRFQTLYHFTVGRGYTDSRIQTRVAYENR
ncbi:SagB/ThcOx family dehydrogenase [Sulfurimonas sp.]|uniref:SagB/ThcOx family dehydrogenase n=1 Tax=Sulfurimonas sp. TaxID=2022749 RepID=UPI0025F891E2|nr:SagB/ThcOx family dehydrogenase [Sulfurimonas sp.]